MSDFDRWLEAPYVDAAREEAAYETWCEEQNDPPLDASEDHWEAYENWSCSQMEQRDQEAIDRGEWGAAWTS